MNFATKPPVSANRNSNLNTNTSCSNQRNLTPSNQNGNIGNQGGHSSGLINSVSLINCAIHLAIMWSNVGNYFLCYLLLQVINQMVFSTTLTNLMINSQKLTLLHNSPMQIQISLTILVLLTMLPKTYKIFFFTLNMMVVMISWLVMVNLTRFPIHYLLFYFLYFFQFN